VPLTDVAPPISLQVLPFIAVACCKVILRLLLQRWPEAELHIIDDAGHSAKEPGITSALVTATDKYKHL